MRFYHLILTPALFLSSLCFAFEGSDRLDQDYARPENEEKPWVLLNESFVSEIAYAESTNINYFLTNRAEFQYIYVKLQCEYSYIASIQSFLDAVPIKIENTAGPIYKIDGYFNKLRISLWQNKTKKADSCLVRLYGTQDRPTQDQFPNNDDIIVLLGEFAAGGDASNQKEIETNGVFLKSIFVSVGKCSDLLIAEVGTLTDKSYDLANPSGNRNLFTVNGGFGLRASKIRIKLVGKSIDTCKVKVYGSVKDFIQVNLP